MNYKTLYDVKVVLLLSWGIALLAILLIIGPQRALDSYGGLTPQGIRDFISSFGLPAVAIYVFLHAIRSFVFLPVTPLTVAGGYLFGLPLGLALTVAGRSIVSGTITFYLSRRLLRDYVQGRIKDKYAGWDRRIERDGVFYVALMRVIPMFPFDAVGYVAGSTRISYKKYMAGTIIGDLPSVFVLTAFGSGLGNPGSPMLYVSAVGAIAAIAISTLYLKLFVARKAREKGIAGQK